jgi:hypothetical protein
MALWLKQEDGTLVEVSGGGGGSFDGEHVLTGDPDSPPEGWAVGQLLYDGLEDAAGDAGPHDHDYLPLSGGTLTGDLFLEGASRSRISNYSSAGSERLSLFGATDGGATIRLYGDGDNSYSAGRVQFLTGGVERMRITQAGRVTVAGDLQIEGIIIGGGLFYVKESIDTADVLERAETATMPAPEEAGVEGLTVNEVVTALLLKVKELSADIKELKGN